MIHFRLLTRVTLLVLAFGAQPVAAQTLLRVATPGALTGALPIYLGAKKGIFQKYGLTVEVIATRNERMNMQTLMSDSVQFLTSSGTRLLYWVQHRSDAVGLASWNNVAPYSFGRRIQFTDIKHLKVRKITASGAGGRGMVRGVIHAPYYPEDAIHTMIKHWRMEREVSVDAYNLVKEALQPVPTEKGVELMAQWQTVAR